MNTTETQNGSVLYCDNHTTHHCHCQSSEC